MEGFFSKKETESTSRPDGKSYSCVSCGRHKDCNTPKMQAAGEFKKGILNIGYMPTTIEDRRGLPFQNKSGKLLEKMYKDVGIKLHEDCLNMYAVNCTTETPPTVYELDCCRKNILKVIKERKPKVVVVFGESALYSLIGHRWKKDFGKIGKWQGWNIPDQELQTWICPTFETDFVLNAKQDVAQVLWKKDLQKVVDLLKVPFKQYEEPEIVELDENDLSILDTISHCDIAFDYETTGLKPHAAGHRIVCASVAVSENLVYTFMMPASRQKRKPFIDLLRRVNVGKIAQNMKYEDTWTEVRLKTSVSSWVWDTMIATHIIDNRSDITGLKFQTYVQFGVIDYDSEVSPYLKAIDNKNANALNRITELLEKPNGKAKLLKYCGYDSINEFRLAKWQRTIIRKEQPRNSPYGANIVEAYKLFHDGVLALAKAERQGLRIDIEYAERQKGRIDKKIEILEKKIYASTFYRHWQHTSKVKVNLNSGPMLGSYLYKVKKIEPAKLTETGKGSTDEEALQMLKIPELDWILERSKLQKVRNTYLEAFIREQVKEYLHPLYNLNLAKTYRSSSSNPNFQNIPKRDKETMNIVRKAIYPRPGNRLLELDFKGIEVAVAACYHKDPTMVKYITDPKSDMHGDMAKQIFMIKDWDKKRPDHALLRGAAKNTFVFPQFYGDYYKNCAANMCSSWLQLPTGKWKSTMGVPLAEDKTIGGHLISSKMQSFDDFTEHIRKIEKDFWTNRFPDYAAWKETHYAMYQKYGYVTLKTGFTCGGLMGKNDVINYPVQGAAFHCLLWCFIEVTNQLEMYGLKSRLVGQIHDALVLDIVPSELLIVHALVTNIVTVQLPKAFSWIIVPMEIEAELCPVDGSWAEKQGWFPEKPFFYYHAESDCHWVSTKDRDEEGDPDGCTEQLTEEEYFTMLKRNAIIEEDIPF